MTPEPPVPVVEDVSVRISEVGDLLGMDFHLQSGQVRSVVFPTLSLPELLAGLLRAGIEAQRRGLASPKAEALRAAIRRNAQIADTAQVGRVERSADALLELEIGAAIFAVRLSREQALELAEQLVAHVELRASS